MLVYRARPFLALVLYTTSARKGLAKCMLDCVHSLNNIIGCNYYIFVPKEIKDEEWKDDSALL